MAAYTMYIMTAAGSCMNNVAAQILAGIPEPGLLMYGTVTNSNSFAVTVASVNWTVSGAGPSAAVASQIVNVNGQYFYIARIPFETRSVAGQSFSATPNTLPLTNPALIFTRSATVNGTTATILAPASPSFSFGKADRGRIERVDLAAALNTDSTLDSDGDGMPDWAETIAGTDPNDPNSVFKVSTDVQPAPGGGLVIKWTSVEGRSYSVSRTSDLGQPFTALAADIPATAPLNQHTDSTATGPGPYFYRLSIR